MPQNSSSWMDPQKLDKGTQNSSRMIPSSWVISYFWFFKGPKNQIRSYALTKNPVECRRPTSDRVFGETLSPRVSPRRFKQNPPETEQDPLLGGPHRWTKRKTKMALVDETSHLNQCRLFLFHVVFNFLTRLA